ATVARRSPGTTRWRAKPAKLGALPFASGVPTVAAVDVWVGGWQEENDSGAACVRLGAVHSVNAGTSETRSGVAPLGADTGRADPARAAPRFLSCWPPSPVPPPFWGSL